MGRKRIAECLSGRALARLLDVSPSTVTGWRKRGCPRRSDGRYELAAVCQWLRAGALSIERMPQRVVIELIGVSKPTIRDWEARGMPRNPDRTYNLRLVLPWVLDRMRATVRETKQQAQEGRDVHRERREAAEATLKEMELDERRGELISRAAALASWVARYQVFRAQAMTLGRRLGELGVAAEQRGTIEAEIQSMLERLASGQIGLQLSGPMRLVVGSLLAAEREGVLDVETAEHVADMIGKRLGRAANADERDDGHNE